MNSEPKPVSTPDPKNLFKDLGRPTLRGVRKCPSCGIYNGIRGLSCKNKECNLVLRGKGRKGGGHNVEAARIITGNSSLIYSVRVRDRGPDFRGFVELPMDGEIIIQGTEPEPVTLTPIPHCYVEACQKQADSNRTLSPCHHVELARKCAAEAQPLTLKNSVLNSLNVTNETKQAIWLLATETTGPLVQRVSKNVMVVKCKPQHKHQLGFLHFVFSEPLRKKGAGERRFHCFCKQFKNFKHEESKKKCVHFYACLCAFASDDALAKEFAYFINLDSNIRSQEPPAPSSPDIPMQITIIDGQVNPSASEALSMAVAIQGQSKKRRKDDLVQASSALLTLQEAAASPTKKSSPNKKTGSAAASELEKSMNKMPAHLPSDAPAWPTISFSHWLGSVTERINQTMHYQFDGCPEPLVFHIPQIFFEVLQQRISSGSHKKRLPNSTVAFIRKDALPLGTFTKYTWQLTNIIHVKRIFDTLDMPLELTRSFVENKDGSFSHYVTPKVDVDQVGETFRRTAGQIPIKPFELKTFLKVGNTSADQKEPTPFIIEWIPDILPKSHIGELRIKFEYGHQRNGHVERRVDDVSAIIEQGV